MLRDPGTKMGVSSIPFLFIFTSFARTCFQTEEAVQIWLHLGSHSKIKGVDFIFNFVKISLPPKRNEEQQFMWSNDELEPLLSIKLD